MEIIKFNHQYDFGHDWYVRLLFTKHWAFFQGSVSWCEYPGWPFLQIQFGSGAMLSIIFNVYKFGISVGFFDRTWKLTDFDSADGVL